MTDRKEKHPAQHVSDEVTEAGHESFPASDPPSHAGSVGPDAPPFDSEEVFDQEEVFHGEEIPESDDDLVDPNQEGSEPMDFPDPDEGEFVEDEILDPEEEGFASDRKLSDTREDVAGTGRLRASSGGETSADSDNAAFDPSFDLAEEEFDVREPTEEADS